jgi:hypothetical protein
MTKYDAELMMIITLLIRLKKNWKPPQPRKLCGRTFQNIRLTIAGVWHTMNVAMTMMRTLTAFCLRCWCWEADLRNILLLYLRAKIRRTSKKMSNINGSRIRNTVYINLL